MLIVTTDKVYLTRGDDASLEIDLNVGNGHYEMQTGDTLTFTMRELPTTDSPVLIEIVSESNRIVFRHEDTAELQTAQYSADIQLTTAGGMRYTIWPTPKGSGRKSTRNWRNFIIMPEVTRT